jgi:hypothetical protein
VKQSKRERERENPWEALQQHSAWRFHSLMKVDVLSGGN